MSVNCEFGRGGELLPPRPLRILDLSLDDPAENLALEEAFVEGLDAGTSPPTLRFWESPTPFVVIGVGQRIAQEADLDACAADGVPVLRRCSAGGCVLQGPGCLNFSLFLAYDAWPEVRDIRPSYCAILGRLVAVLKEKGIADAAIEGTSDLAVGGRKFSGNAQKRKRHALLHHGTLLYGALPNGLSRYIREPEERPGYRGARSHAAFVTALPVAAQALREAVIAAFASPESAAEPPTAAEREQVAALAQSKYETPEWNARR